MAVKKKEGTSVNLIWSRISNWSKG